MTRQAYFVRAPRVAGWLVDLFASHGQAESMSGDLQEEFSDVASKSGVAVAHRWYWRQSVKSIPHLIGTEFRVAPRLIISTVLGGWLLLALGDSLPVRAINAVLRYQHVNPYYANFDLWVFCYNRAIQTGYFIEAVLIGCIVAMAAKSREMVATITLGLIRGVFTGVGILVLVAKRWPESAVLLPFLVFPITNMIAIFIGGAIVRMYRSDTAHEPLPT
jgi:hypothetical protein